MKLVEEMCLQKNLIFRSFAMYRYRIRLGLCSAFTCGAFFVIITYIGRPPGDVLVNHYVNEEYNRETLLELVVYLYGRSRLLDIICYDHITYVEIRDEIVEVNGRKEIRRGAKKDNKLLTYVYLKIPEKLTKNSLDTSNWEVDVYRKPRRYQGGIIDELLASGILSPTSKSNARVLMLGLEGILYTYLHHTFPEIKEKFLKSFKYARVQHVGGTTNYILTFTRFKH
ncbi:hypothetical protein GCK32_001189 [Trichostrongylus colubriformis]|uniref:Uncharacterized protein n=1 Tax=Trichostrongylus colubriformis TaxID=6319 RepID=A0AAN8IPQ9_TRICO